MTYSFVLKHDEVELVNVVDQEFIGNNLGILSKTIVFKIQSEYSDIDWNNVTITIHK